MSSLKYRPMAVIGITALILNFVAILTGLVFSCGLIFLAVGAVMTVILLISKEFGRFTVIAYICAALIFSGVLLMTSSVFGFDIAEKYTDEKCDVVATVSGEQIEYNNSNAYIIKAESINKENCDFKIIVYSRTSFDFEAGDKIKFHSKLCDNLSSKKFTTKISNISDERYLYTSIYDSSEITLIKSGEKSIQHYLYFIRNEIKSRIYNFLPGEEGAVTVAMLIGDKSDVDDNILDDFRTTGVSHLFAVSGLHLSVWIASLYIVLRKMIKRNKISEILCIIFTLVFMALTGFTASVCRAGIMLIVIFTAKIFDEETDSLNSLGFALFIILTLRPMSAVSVSLLLSFSATLGIVTAYPYLESKTNEKLFLLIDKSTRKIIKYVLNLIEISVCASVFTLPVSAFFIGNISTIAPVTNVFISLAATTQMVLGGLSALFFNFNFIARPLAFICGVFAKYIIYFTSFLSKIPLCSVGTDSVYFRLALIVIFTAIICLFMLVGRNKKRFIASLSIVLSVSIIFTSMYIVLDYSKTFIDVFNAGGGLSVQIKYHGHSFILGCGGSEKYPDENTISLLKEKPDLLLIPDRKPENSSMFLYYIQSYSPKKIFSGENNQSVSQLRQDAIVSQNFKYNFSRNEYLIFKSDLNNSYAYYKNSDGEYLIIFESENTDFIPKNYFSSDYLVICNDVCDNFDFSYFKKIIVADSVEIDVKNKYIVNDSEYLEIEA